MPDDLMAGNQRQLRIRQFATDDVKIGAANRARTYTNEQLSRVGLRLGHIEQHEPLPRFFENHRAHLDLLRKIMRRRRASARGLRRHPSAWAHLHDAYERCAETALYQERALGTIRARDK